MSRARVGFVFVVCAALIGCGNEVSGAGGTDPTSTSGATNNPTSGDAVASTTVSSTTTANGPTTDISSNATSSGQMPMCDDVQPTTAASTGSGMDPNCTQGQHPCSPGKGCSCQGPLLPFCGCDGWVTGAAGCTMFDYSPDASLCSHGTFPCGDVTCRQYVEYCVAAQPGSGHVGECLPAPPECTFGVTSCDCVPHGSDTCRSDGGGGIVVGCVCDETDSFSCGTDGTCDASGACQYWPAGTACAGCGQAGTCDGTGTCDVAPGACASGFCWQDACATITAITGGGSHVCARTSTGSVQCWGDNSIGQLGNGLTARSSVPVPVSQLPSGVVALAAGGAHTCALTSTGSIACWGYNNEGALGDGTTVSRPTPVMVVGAPADVVAISAGGNVTCLLAASGEVKCMGQGEYGGSNCSERALVASPVVGLPADVVAIDASGSRTCALTSGGAVHCWGTLGDDFGTISFAPMPVTGLDAGVVSLAVGGRHNCAVTSAGALLCWGNNEFGALGDGTTTSSPSAVAVPALASGVSSVAVGDLHSCAITSGGAVMCWGNNGLGQLGTGTTDPSLVPLPVSGLSSGAVALALGAYSSCALMATGTVKCWGTLPDGFDTPALVPADIVEP